MESIEQINAVLTQNGTGCSVRETGQGLELYRGGQFWLSLPRETSSLQLVIEIKNAQAAPPQPAASCGGGGGQSLGQRFAEAAVFGAGASVGMRAVDAVINGVASLFGGDD